MRVLVTGAAGNIGRETVDALLEAGHQVRAFDLDRRQTRKALRRYGDRVELSLGDLSSEQDVRRAVEGQQVILHNAAVLPPVSEREPGLARRVNVEGTERLIEAARAEPEPPRLLFASSIAVFGNCRGKQGPSRADDPQQPTDHYGRHKVECERMLRGSGLSWCIVRIAAAPPASPTGGSPAMLRYLFERSLDDRVEYVHPADVAYAQARAVETEAAWDKVLLLGGGPGCQITNRELVRGTFEALGIGALPEEAFGDEPMPGGWLDTEESQRLLGFQRHSYQDSLDELRRSVGLARWFVGLVAPRARKFLLRYSEPYQRRRMA